MSRYIDLRQSKTGFFHQIVNVAQEGVLGFLKKEQPYRITHKDRFEIGRGSSYAVFPELDAIAGAAKAAKEKAIGLEKIAQEADKEVHRAEIATKKAERAAKKAEARAKAAEQALAESRTQGIAPDYVEKAYDAALKRKEANAKKEEVKAKREEAKVIRQDFTKKRESANEAQEASNGMPGITIEAFQKLLAEKGVTDEGFQNKILSLILQHRVGLHFRLGAALFGLLCEHDMCVAQDYKISLSVVNKNQVKFVYTTNCSLISDESKVPQLQACFEVTITPECVVLNQLRITNVSCSQEAFEVMKSLDAHKARLWDKLINLIRQCLRLPSENIIAQKTMWNTSKNTEEGPKNTEEGNLKLTF